MKSIFLYKSHTWNWFYISERKLSSEEIYCELCHDSDRLIGTYCDKKALYLKLNQLWKDGWSLLVTERNKEITFNIIDKKYLRIPYAEICC